MTTVVRRVIVRGLVHGVGFRAFVEDEANLRGIDGWVRNRRDGTVEAVFAGAIEIVEDMITACRRGPKTARVDHVETRSANEEELNLRPPGEQFSTLMTD
jgi:acylphosphatase